MQTGATTYLSDGFPFIWESALWFPLAVGAATVAVGELRARLAPLRPWSGAEPAREAVAAIASVLAIYAVTALVSDRPEGAATTLTVMLAALAAARFASGRAALICGLAAAIGGPLAEIALVEAGAAAYGPSADGLFGVALWLAPLYFAFGVVVSRLVELAPALLGEGGEQARRAERSGRGGGGDAVHRLELGARQAADDDRVERLVAGQRRADLLGALGLHADRSRPLAEPLEVVAVAVVQVAVEALLLGEPRLGVGADRGPHVAEDRRRRVARPPVRRPRPARGRRAANSGVIQLKKTPS